MSDNRLAKVMAAAAVAGGLACLVAAPASAQSLTDRFKGLFGGKSDEEPAANAPARIETCGQSMSGWLSDGSTSGGGAFDGPPPKKSFNLSVNDCADALATKAPDRIRSESAVTREM